MLGDFALFVSLPSLCHVAQIPVAPLTADIQAVLQEPVLQPDAQAEAAALQANGLKPLTGGQLTAVQPAVEVPTQGASQPASQPEFFVSC